jgi:pimeloyl-ACP methyl ester carboxylesterase
MLRDVGHVVFTPTLTGLGERAHLARPEVDLSLHVRDVVALLEMEELRQVILVGHSYGGMVVTGVAAEAGARLAQLVYLDAFVPTKGQALLDLVSPDVATDVRVAARECGEGWRIPPFPPERFGVTNAKDVEWLARHLVPQPLRTLEEPVTGEAPPRLNRTYIYCSKPAMGPFDQFRRLATDRAWRFHDVATGHDAMVTAAGEIATLLLKSA